MNTEIEQLKKESNRRRLMILLLEKEIQNLKANNKVDMTELCEVNAIIRKERDELKEQLDEANGKVKDYTEKLFGCSVEKDKLEKQLCEQRQYNSKMNRENNRLKEEYNKLMGR